MENLFAASSQSEKQMDQRQPLLIVVRNIRTEGVADTCRLWEKSRSITKGNTVVRAIPDVKLYLPQTVCQTWPNHRDKLEPVQEKRVRMFYRRYLFSHTDQKKRELMRLLLF